MNNQKLAKKLEQMARELRAEDKPQRKTGVILSHNEVDGEFYIATFGGNVDKHHDAALVRKTIYQGRAFHDEECAERFSRYERLRVEARQAMRKDREENGPIDWEDGKGKYVVLVLGDDVIAERVTHYYERLAFLSEKNRDDFIARYSEDDLRLMITGGWEE